MLSYSKFPILRCLQYQSSFPSYFTCRFHIVIFTETLRKFLIFPFLDRKRSSDYELAAPTAYGTVTLPAGTSVYIPALGLHYDPAYFPEPEKFDPDRFTEENKQSRPNYTYIPFGEGPRMCISEVRRLLIQHMRT